MRKQEYVPNKVTRPNIRKSPNEMEISNLPDSLTGVVKKMLTELRRGMNDHSD